MYVDACYICMRYIYIDGCHAMYVCDIYIDTWIQCMYKIYIYCECMLACNVCMRYVCCKMANVQSETLI